MLIIKRDHNPTARHSKFAHVDEVWFARGIIAPGSREVGYREVPREERLHPMPTPKAQPIDQATIDDWYAKHPRANAHGRAALRTARAKARAKHARDTAKTVQRPWGVDMTAPPRTTYLRGSHED